MNYCLIVSFRPPHPSPKNLVHVVVHLALRNDTVFHEGKCLINNFCDFSKQLCRGMDFRCCGLARAHRKTWCGQSPRLNKDAQNQTK